MPLRLGVQTNVLLAYNLLASFCHFERRDAEAQIFFYLGVQE